MPAMNSTWFSSLWRRNLFKARRFGYTSDVSQVSDLPDSDLPNPPTLPIAESKSKTWATSVTHVPSWPQDARPLKKRNWIAHLYSVADVILVLLPIYFILLGIAVIKLNGKLTKDNDLGTKVEFAIQLGPTIFPIVFAAISGRSMKMYARYIAEKGANISTLELLMASQSVWGTVESQLLMQRLTVVGVNLLFLWALSPLGGQASLRLMKRDDMASYSSTKLRYLSTGPGAVAMGLSSTFLDNGKFSDASALFSAALLAPLATKNGPQDAWGNVKIPSIAALGSSKVDAEGWINVPRIETPETFSSLVGLPLVGLPSKGTSNFSLESSYVSVECGKFNQTPWPSVNGDTDFTKTNWTELEVIAPGYVWPNMSSLNPFQDNTKGSIPTSFFIDTTRPTMWDTQSPDYETLVGRFDGFVGNINQSRLNEVEMQTKRELRYVSIYKPNNGFGDYGLNIAICSLSQNHVEVIVRCNEDKCVAEKVRKSLSDTRPSAFTGFEHTTIMQGFSKRFATAITSDFGSSPTERFLTNSSSLPFIQQLKQPQLDVAYVNMSLVPPEVFSRRLSLLLNTFYQLSMQPTGYFGSLSTNLSTYGPDTLPVTDINVYLPSNLTATNSTFADWWVPFQDAVQDIESPFIGATTMANVTTVQEIFVCNFAWLALLLASSGIIFIIGGFALILKRKTLGPEIFGFVTSMTYDNPYVRIGNGPLGGGTTMDAMERARLLKDVKVYIGDVQGDADVGHIAMAAGVPLRKLERGRLYL